MGNQAVSFDYVAAKIFYCGYSELSLYGKKLVELIACQDNYDHWIDTISPFIID
jgi:hypothetical protein